MSNIYVPNGVENVNTQVNSKYFRTALNVRNETPDCKWNKLKLVFEMLYRPLWKCG